jgi:hypothetical protein
MLIDFTVELLELQTLSAYRYRIERIVELHIFSFPANLSANEGA